MLGLPVSFWAARSEGGRNLPMPLWNTQFVPILSAIVSVARQPGEDQPKPLEMYSSGALACYEPCGLSFPLIAFMWQ